MLLGGGVFGFLVLALWVYCIFDVISTDAAVIENLPKMAWLIIVIILPTLGSLAWLLLGRPRGASWNVGGLGAPRQDPRLLGRAVAPPELPPIDEEEHRRMREEALRKHEAEREETQRRKEAELEAMRLQAWEEELRRREDELRRKDPGE